MNNSENVSVLSESEVLVMFVTPDGEDIARNISEYYKIIQRWRIGKESKERNIKIRPSIYLKENFMQKYIYIYILFVCFCSLHKYTSEGVHTKVQITLLSKPE